MWTLQINVVNVNGDDTTSLSVGGNVDYFGFRPNSNPPAWDSGNLAWNIVVEVPPTGYQDFVLATPRVFDPATQVPEIRVDFADGGPERVFTINTFDAQTGLHVTDYDLTVTIFRVPVAAGNIFTSPWT